MLLRIEGQFKNYAGLLQALGIADDTKIDPRWRQFLRKAGSDNSGDINASAGKEIMLANYDPLNRTFDTVWRIPQPTTTKPGETPVPSGLTVMDMPRGEESRYANNLPLRTVDSFTCTDCDQTVYCTECGFTVELSKPYEMLPEFTWEEVYNGNVEKNVADTDGNDQETGVVIDGTKVRFDVYKNGLIWCPWHRGFGKFETVADSINRPTTDKPPVTQEAIPTVNDRSIPGPFKYFKATDDQVEKIIFTWAMFNYGYPSPKFDLYNSGGLVAENIGNGYTLEVPGGGTDDYFVQAYNSEGSLDSDIATGTAL